MDTGLTKSTPESQMSEMMLLMQMENHSPEFCSGSPSGLPLSDFSSGDTPMNNFLSPPFPYPAPQGGLYQSPPELAFSGDKQSSMAAMREMIFRIAAMQPIYIDPESVKPPKRRNVRISKDPQSVAARHRRERISERIRVLQRLVPGGTKMDTASMLDEAIHYVKFLKSQVQALERAAVGRQNPPVGHGGLGFPVVVNEGGYFPVMLRGEGSLQQGQGFSSDG